jgi:2-polyprenyl-3-methyl-5-hydroxy-6-metoxy-1,4-benzoquinol methylase
VKRGYQRDFSLTSRNPHDFAQRRRKAETIAAVMRDVLGAALAGAVVLDVGASTGAITAALCEHVRAVVGIDIDPHAIATATSEFANAATHFAVGDAMQLAFADHSVDVVLCAHVYEHVPDPTRMMQEIRRVLKPGGWCYLSAGNRLAVDEPHYHLPFLSVLPKWMAHIYLRLLGRGTHYYEEHLSWWGLRRLVAGFDVVDYTRRVIADPERFHTAYMVAPHSHKQRAALWLVDHAMWLCPGYVWMLRSPMPPGPA